MPLIASAQSSGPKETCPAGVHDAVCAFVEDLGHEYSEMYKNWNRKVVICWEINEPMSDGKPFMLSKRYTLSLGKKANLLKDVQGWRGKNFTDAELAGFDLEVLRGKQCQLQVIHNEKEGKVYANIISVLPKGKSSPVISVVNKEVPKWIAEQRAKNEDAYSKSDYAPIIVADDDADHAPKIPAAGGNHEEAPFARPLTADFWG
jgi:hypothetical protein